jgi:outer membrane protein OmpA-like peptidoglycan-associated protein
MPLFIKKEDEEQQEQFINELKTPEQQPETGQTKQTSTPEQTFQPRIQLQATQTKKQDQLPKGTFAVIVISANFEFARFTIKPEIYPEAVEMIKNLLQTLNEPQLKLNSNCDCIWCQQKIKELQDYLLG